MAYIGNTPSLSYTSFAKQDFTTSATTSYTLDNPVANENELALFINFVRQEPTTAYTASGTSLTLTSATSASDDMYCVFLGKAVQTVNPPNSSVGTSQLDSSLDFSSKTITLADNMKNTPAFFVYKSSTQTLTDAAFTLITFDTEQIDTDNAFASNTFTVPSGQGGTYVIGAHVEYNAGTGSNLRDTGIEIRINGTVEARQQSYFEANYPLRQSQRIEKVVSLSAGDTVTIYGLLNVGSGTCEALGQDKGTNFYGYKIIE